MSESGKKRLAGLIMSKAREIAEFHADESGKKLPGSNMVAVCMDLSTNDGRVAHDVLVGREGAAFDQILRVANEDGVPLGIIVVPHHDAVKLSGAMNDGVRLKIASGPGIPVLGLADGITLSVMLTRPPEV
jgi:hypothetical protein